MKLFEHPDFEQAVLRAGQHFQSRGLRPAIIEKDYFVTEALRVISGTAGDKIIFKGGTSLSKGWNLIQRFSEDIDIFLDPQGFAPKLGKHGIDRELKRLRDAITQHPALLAVPTESQTIGGFGRSDRFSYPQRFGGPGEVVNRVLLEAGTASGREPTAGLMKISSRHSSHICCACKGALALCKECDAKRLFGPCSYLGGAAGLHGLPYSVGCGPCQ